MEILALFFLLALFSSSKPKPPNKVEEKPKDTRMELEIKADILSGRGRWI